jgi:outer membrane protein TolC
VLLDAVQGALLDVRDGLARLSTARQDHEALARGRELSFQVYEF